MWIYKKSDQKILEVNNAAVNAYGYSKYQFRHLFHDDFIGEEIPVDYPDGSKSELRKQLSIHRASNGGSFVTLMVKSLATYNSYEAILVRSIKVFN